MSLRAQHANRNVAMSDLKRNAAGNATLLQVGFHRQKHKRFKTRFIYIYFSIFCKSIMKVIKQSLLSKKEGTAKDKVYKKPFNYTPALTAAHIMRQNRTFSCDEHLCKALNVDKL